MSAAVARAKLLCYRALLVALPRFRLNWGLFTRFPLLKRVYHGLLGATKPDGPTVLTVDGRRMYVDTRDEGSRGSFSSEALSSPRSRDSSSVSSRRA